MLLTFLIPWFMSLVTPALLIFSEVDPISIVSRRCFMKDIRKTFCSFNTYDTIPVKAFYHQAQLYFCLEASTSWPADTFVWLKALLKHG